MSGAGPTSARRTSLSALAAAGVILAAGFLLWPRYGPQTIARVLDSDAVRGWALGRDEGATLDWALARMSVGSRPVASEQLPRLRILASRGAAGGRALQALEAIDVRQGLPDAMREEIVEEFLAAPPARDTWLLLLVASLAQRHAFGTDVETKLLAWTEPPGGGVQYVAIRALGQLGTQRALQPETMAALERLTRHRDSTTRYVSLEALASAAPTSELSAALLDDLARIAAEARNNTLRSAALQVLVADRDLPRARRAALGQAGALSPQAVDALLALYRSDHPDGLAAIVTDHALPGTLRATALERAMLPTEDPAKIAELIDDAVSDGDPELRRTGVALLGDFRSRYGSAPDVDWRDLLTRTLRDPDDGVRQQATRTAFLVPIGDGERTALLQDVLSRGTAQERRSLLRALGSSRVPMPGLEGAIDGLRQAEDPETAALARTLWERDHLPAEVPKRASGWLGGAAFTGLVGLPIALCACFAVYYLARLLTYVGARRWRALLAIGVLALWAGLSTVLGWSIFAFALGLGHGHRLSGLESAAVLGIYLGVLAVYGSVGWLLHYPVRR